MKRTDYLRTQVNTFTVLLLTSVFLTCSTENKKSIDYLGQEPPGPGAKLFAPGIVSTASFEHSAPAFSPDGTVVLWTVVDSTYHASLSEMKYAEGRWSGPHKPSFADTTADDYYPSFSPDGKKLYFSSRRKVPPGYPNDRDMRIWVVDKEDNGWGNPIPFDSTVSQGHEYAHSVAENGTLYFSSSLGGSANWNIRKSEFVDGHYTKPALLPYSINSVDYEDGPYIAPDESFLIFESQRPEGTDGSIDLYISFQNSAGSWSTPINMGPEINSRGSERFARLSPDGKYLFFGSTRNQSINPFGFDIFWISTSVIDRLRSEALTQGYIEKPFGEELINALYANDSKTSANLLSQWLGAHPNSLDATVVYSSVLRKQRRYAEAEQLLSNGLSQWEKNSSLIMEMALVKFGLKKDDESATLLAPILVEGDQLRERYIYLSGALLDMREFKTSDEYFEKAMAIFPSRYPCFRRACAYARLGEKDRAFAYLNRAVDLGHKTTKDFEDNADLMPLKSDVRWKPLMEKLK